MVKRLLNLLYREWSGLHQAAFLLGFFALLSQVLGLIRDRLLAHMFGAGEMLDLYYAAFRIPDFLYVSLASFVSVTVLIPFLLKRFEQAEASAREFLNQTFTAFFFTITAVACVLYGVIPFLSTYLFAGFLPEMQGELVTLTRILLLSPILLGLSNLMGSVIQSFRKFFVYALSPLLYNTGIIVGIVFFHPFLGMEGLVWGVVLGAALHMGIQIPALLSLRFVPSFSLRINMADLKEVILLSLPRTIGLSIHQIALLALIVWASLMAAGSISVFQFAFNLQSVPLAIVGVSYSVAAFPTLARLFSQNNLEHFRNYMAIAARHIVFWSLPVIALFIVLRAQIVRTILGSGAFDWTDTRLTAASLALFSISLVAQGLILLFVRAFYASGDTRTPLFVNVGGAFLVMASAYGFLALFSGSEFFRDFLESLLRVSDLPGTSVVVLPLAYSAGMIVNAWFLGVLFTKKFGPFSIPVRRVFAHSFAASVFMGFIAYQMLNIFDDVFNLETLAGIFLQGLFSGVLGIIAGVALLALLKNREIEEIGAAIRGRFWSGKAVVAPEKEEL